MDKKLNTPQVLTQAEYEEMMQDMKESIEWAKAELQTQREKALIPEEKNTFIESRDGTK